MTDADALPQGQPRPLGRAGQGLVGARRGPGPRDDARVGVDGRRARAAAGLRGARAGGRHRRGRLPRRRADRARRHADLLRLRARDDHRGAGARRADGDHQRALPPDRRRGDRPARRVARRRAVPLGLHADGRRRGGAAGDAARAQAGRAASRWRRGRARARTRGRRSRARSWSSAGTSSAPIRTRPASSRWARAGTIEEHLEAAGFGEHQVETVDFVFIHPSFDAWIATTRDFASLLPRRARRPARGRARGRDRRDPRARARVRAGGRLGSSLPARSWVAAAAA